VQNGDVYLDLNEKGKLDVGGAIGKDGYLTVISDLGLKEPYIGKIPLVTGEVGDDLAQYFYVSEQVASVVALGVLVDKDLSIKASGGMIIQLLPGASEEIINIIEENIKKIQSVTTCFENSKTPEDLIEMALSGIDFHFTDKKEISYRCNCSETRVRNVLKSVGKTELEAIEQASNSPYASVNTHIKKALLLYSDRKKPDYENSIKESISAVEAMCCTITGMKGASATLGTALKNVYIRHTEWDINHSNLV
jgi:redox-regulated HSP33 family molecular chaperone